MQVSQPDAVACNNQEDSSKHPIKGEEGGVRKMLVKQITSPEKQPQVSRDNLEARYKAVRHSNIYMPYYCTLESGNMNVAQIHGLTTANLLYGIAKILLFSQKCVMLL